MAGFHKDAWLLGYHPRHFNEGDWRVPLLGNCHGGLVTLMYVYKVYNDEGGWKDELMMLE